MFLMEDLAGKLSVEKGHLRERLYDCFSADSGNLGFIFFILLYQYSVTKPFVFMFHQPFVKGYSHKHTESSISAKSLVSTHKRVL